MKDKDRKYLKYPEFTYIFPHKAKSGTRALFSSSQITYYVCSW